MQITSTDDLCRIRWWYICINGRSENASLALWAIMVDFQYHIMGHLCNDYPQMVTTYCCLVKGKPGLIWLHVNRVYVWESGNRKTQGTGRWVARNNERAFYVLFTMMQLSNLFLCWLWCCSLLVIGHTSPYIPLSTSHYGTWQRDLICSLKINPTT